MMRKILHLTVLTVAAAPSSRLRGNAMIKRSMVLALALLASGCGGQNQNQSQTQAPTNAQRQMEAIKGVFATASFSQKTCYDEVNSHPDSVAAKELLPLDEPNKPSITQLASTARPTRDQITKIVAYKQNLDKCDEQVAAKLRDVNPGFYDIIRRTNQNQDGIIVNLMHGKLNVGGAVLALQAERQHFDQEGKALGQKIQASLYQQQNAEISQRNAYIAQQQAAQAQGEADLAAFGNSMQAASAQFNQGVQQRAQAATSFQPTPVMPLTQPGGDQVRCITAGIYTNCRSY
jgi:hypothetical protein